MYAEKILACVLEGGSDDCDVRKRLASTCHGAIILGMSMTTRVVDDGNRLLEECINATSVNIFNRI